MMEEAVSQLPPVVLVAAYAVFWGWEAFYSARQQAGHPGRRRRNLVISVICIAIAAISGTGVLWLSAAVAAKHRGILNAVELPLWLAILVGVLLLDLTDYGRHRFTHAFPPLWRLHRVHHSDVAIDVTTSLRNHPFEILLRPLFLGAAVLVFGIHPLAVLLLPLLQLPVLVFQHANVRLAPAADNVLVWFIVTPGMHLVHHSRAKPQTDSNYATFLSVWDRLFGTFRPTVVPARVGLDAFDQPPSQTLLGMLATPWR
jgi:sterol desaturase/sphingolipid hydroxylase (fatty acid hydroxylase superfamily)